MFILDLNTSDRKMKYHVFNVRTNNRRLSWGEKIYETKNTCLIRYYNMKVNMVLNMHRKH